MTLKCAARGSPQPTIAWRRENGEPIAITGQRDGKLMIFHCTLYAAAYGISMPPAYNLVKKIDKEWTHLNLIHGF